MTDRELGAAAHECPICGTALAAEAQPDGSVAVSACPTCYPAEAPEAPQAPAAPVDQAPTAEQAKRMPPTAPPREQGTAVNAPQTVEGVNQ